MELYNALGTYILVGPLFGILLTLIMCSGAFSSEVRSLGSDALFLVWGGKIGRLWYFLNIIILAVLSFIVALIYRFLHNWIILLVCIPYQILFYLLFWNNAYKRINAVLDHKKASLTVTIFWALLGIATFVMRKYEPDSYTACQIIIDFICFVLFVLTLFVPSKKTDELKNDIIQECKDL